MTRRLIEDWLPISEIGIESLRERTPMTPFPAPNRLHVWWARRPLVASRAAVLGSLLPTDADRDKFLRVIGVHGDPSAARKRIDRATREGIRLGKDAYGYSRAFLHSPTAEELAWVSSEGDKIGASSPTVLDPTAGGGSIPFESARLGFKTFANDLNPVASIVERATVEWPLLHGLSMKHDYLRIGSQFVERVKERLAFAFPAEPEADTKPDGYLWARTIRCPHCDGLVPLAPNWRLSPDGWGVRLQPQVGTGPGDPSRHVEFEIVERAKDQSLGTVSGGDATCPFSDCGRLISGDDVKAQAQAGKMAEQLYAVVFRRRVVVGYTKTGKAKEKWVRGYRPPRSEDDVSQIVKVAFDEKLPDWQAMDIIPSESIGELSNGKRLSDAPPKLTRRTGAGGVG